MVINYGMSEIGPFLLTDPSAQNQDLFMRMMSRNSMSEKMLKAIDEEVKKIVAKVCY